MDTHVSFSDRHRRDRPRWRGRIRDCWCAKVVRDDGAGGDFHLRGDGHRVVTLDSWHTPTTQLRRAERREDGELERTNIVRPVYQEKVSLTLALVRARAGCLRAQKSW